VQQHGVQAIFAKLLVLAGIAAPPGRRRPRIHDYADLLVMPTSAR